MLSNSKAIKMTTSTIKSNLHQMIDDLDDKKILEAIYTLLSSKNPAKPNTYHVSREELEAIDAGVRDIDAGKVYTYKQVREKIRRKHNL